LAGVLETPGRRLLAGPARVLAAFGIGRGQRVLEIGPGTGFYSLEAARRVGPSGKLICLDIQEEMLQETRRRLAAAGLTALFVRADARRLPLRSAALDHVVLITVLGEIPERKRRSSRSCECFVQMVTSLYPSSSPIRTL
jgi:ubiquinone/menaquinone biosynthesis C-methylase UbiE